MKELFSADKQDAVVSAHKKLLKRTFLLRVQRRNHLKQLALALASHPDSE